MSISVAIDFKQLKEAIRHCDANEKMELIRLLQKETFPNRFRQLLQQLKTDELSFDDITQEMEAVRKAKYDASGH